MDRSSSPEHDFLMENKEERRRKEAEALIRQGVPSMLADQVSDAMRDMDDKDRERDNAMSRDAHSMEAVFDLIAGLESKDTILENPKIDWTKMSQGACDIFEGAVKKYKSEVEQKLIRAQLSQLSSEEERLQNALRELELKKQRLLMASPQQPQQKQKSLASPAASVASSSLTGGGGRKKRANDDCPRREFCKLGHPILSESDEEKQESKGLLVSDKMPLTYDEFVSLNNKDAKNKIADSVYNQKKPINPKSLRSLGIELGGFKETLRNKCVKYGRITNLSKFLKKKAVAEIAAKKGIEDRELWKVYNSTWDLLTGISLIRVRSAKPEASKKHIVVEDDEDEDDDDDDIIIPAPADDDDNEEEVDDEDEEA